MMDCLLCLELNHDLECIYVDSTQWEELKIEGLIDKHLWPISTINPKSCLCSICWNELKKFHLFYNRIEEAHHNLESLLKNEADPLEEDIKPKDLLMEIVIDPTLAKSTAIKQENDELDNDVDSGNNNNNHQVIIPDNDHGFSDYNSGDCSEDTNSDDDLPLVNKCKKYPKRGIIKDKRGSNDNSDPEVIKSNSMRKSYYQPKTNRSEYDQFLKEHFKMSCNNCLQTFETFRLLTEHYSKEHNERGFAVCCDSKFFNRRLLVDHINYHLNPEFFKCRHCGKVFSKRRCLLAHNKSHEELKHKCDKCDKKFVEKTKLDRHKLTHLSEEEKKFPCNECGKFYGDEYTLTLHQRVVHQNIYAKVCEICGQTMPDSNSFKRHMEKHDTTSPSTSVKCDECGLILSGKLTLKHHKDLKHPVGGKRDYTCHICMKVSPNMKALKKHIQCTHEMGYNYKCTVCEKAFKRSDNLKAHLSTHTGTPLYRCPWCPKEFNSNGNMHNHRKKAHPIEWEEARRKKYSGNLPPNYKPPPTTTSNSQCSST